MLKGGIEHTQPIFRGCSWPERRARSRYFGEEAEKASHVDKPAGTMHSVERQCRGRPENYTIKLRFRHSFEAETCIEADQRIIQFNLRFLHSFEAETSEEADHRIITSNLRFPHSFEADTSEEADHRMIIFNLSSSSSSVGRSLG